MTRLELQTRILDGVNEASAAPVFWSAAQIQASIQEAMEVLAEDAGAVRRTGYFALKPGATYYSSQIIGPDVIAPYRMWSPSLHRRLEPIALADLDDRHAKWPTVTGEPQAWFPVSWDTFGIWPAATEGGGVIRADYFAWPRVLLDDDDSPEFPEADQEAITLYGMYDGFAKQWKAMDTVNAWATFERLWLKAVDRSGVARIQATTWQRGDN